MHSPFSHHEDSVSSADDPAVISALVERDEKDFAVALQKHRHALHEWKETFESNLLESLSGVQVSTEFSQNVDPVEYVCKIAKERGVDFVVVGTHNRTALGEFLMGSVSHDILHKCTVPVILCSEHHS